MINRQRFDVFVKWFSRVALAGVPVVLVLWLIYETITGTIIWVQAHGDGTKVPAAANTIIAMFGDLLLVLGLVVFIVWRIILIVQWMNRRAAW
jgi:hypothetical protein